MSFVPGEGQLVQEGSLSAESEFVYDCQAVEALVELWVKAEIDSLIKALAGDLRSRGLTRRGGVQEQLLVPLLLLLLALSVSDFLVAQVEVVSVVLPEQAVAISEGLDVIDQQRC